MEEYYYMRYYPDHVRPKKPKQKTKQKERLVILADYLVAPKTRSAQ